MKKIISSILPIIIAVLFASNTNANNREQKISLVSVYETYFSLKDALVNDNNKGAKNAAITLMKNINSVDASKLGNKKTDWEKYKAKLLFDAEHISDSDLGHQREHFVTLSKNLFNVMKLIKYDKTVYYQHCPMYNQKRGGAYWISLNKEIRNPYLGKKMTSCGDVIESLKQD